MIPKKNSFLADLRSVFSSKVLTLGLGLVNAILTARYLGPSNNGIIAAILVFPNLFMAIGALGVQQSTTYLIGQNRFSSEQIFGAVVSVWFFTSIFCVVSSFLLISFFAKEDYPLDLVFIGVLAIPFSLFNTYTAGIYLGKQMIKEFNRINWIPALINLFFTFLLIVVVPLGVKGSMLGTFLGAAIFSVLLILQLRRQIKIKFKFNKKIIKQLLSLGIVYAITTLIASLNYRVDIVLLERWSNSYELGIYSKGANLVELLWQIPVLLSTIIFSRSAGAKNSKEFSYKVCRLLRFAGISILCLSLVFFVLSKFIIGTLYGREFLPSAQVINILLPGVILMIIYKVLYMDVAGRGKPWMSMEAMIPAIILNVILNYFFIPKWGANGSAFASTLSYSLAAIIFLFVYSRHTKISLREMLRFNDDDKLMIKRLLIKFKIRKC